MRNAWTKSTYRLSGPLISVSGSRRKSRKHVEPKNRDSHASVLLMPAQNTRKLWELLCSGFSRSPMRLAPSRF